MDSTASSRIMTGGFVLLAVIVGVLIAVTGSVAGETTSSKVWHV